MEAEERAEMYFGGMPTGPDVKRLEDAFGAPGPGLIEHERIEAVIGYRRDVVRYRTVLAAWRKKLLRVHNIDTDMEPGHGVRVLREGERVNCSARDFQRGARKVRRSWIRNSLVDVTKLDQRQLGTHDFLAVSAAKSVQTLTENTKALANYMRPPVPLPKAPAPES